MIKKLKIKPQSQKLNFSTLTWVVTLLASSMATGSSFGADTSRPANRPAEPSTGTIDPLPSECLKNAENFGENDHPMNREFHKCFATALQNAEPQNIRTSPDGKTQAVGYKNMLFIRNQNESTEAKQIHIVAGRKTRFHDIRSLALNMNEESVIVLNDLRKLGETRSKPSLMTYRWKWSGNLYPIRRSYAPELAGAQGLAPDPKSGLLFVAIPDQKAILILSLAGDIEGRSPEGTTRALGWIQGTATELQTPQELAIDSERQELIVADPDSNRITTFAISALLPELLPITSSRDATKKFNIVPSSQISSVAPSSLRLRAIDYEPASHSIVVRYSDGSSHKFSRAR